MSKTEDDFDITEHRSTAGAEVKTADVSSDDHDLKQKLGDQKERQYDAKVAGERFVQFYDDSGAAIREYLSNAETACIRRARQELIEEDIEPPSNISELLALARDEADYEPLIEVTYNRKDDETRLIIEDNGIGISTNEYRVVQKIGYSTSHNDGDRLGQFGMGWMSGFQLTSIHGVFRMYTRSFLTDEAYSTQEYVANCEYLDGAPEDYGTRFEFPAFGAAAKELDIPAKVAEYCDGMRVPVLYRDFDESGQETSRSDDYLPMNIESDYDEDSLVVTYEDEFFKAVMSPDSPSRENYVTYNVTMPIRRNTDSYGSNPKFSAPWTWDFRGKREDGPIVSCDSDESLVGLAPIENTKYDSLPKEQQDDYVPMSEVPDDAITMPGPASSRDSYMSGHDEFWKYVSSCLLDAWGDVARTRFESLDSWDDFRDMSREEKEGLLRAYRQFGPSYKQNEPDTIQEKLEDALGVTIDADLCEKLDKSRGKMMVVPRGHQQAHRKKPAKGNKKKIWKIIDEAPDGVYMGKSISQKKSEIAWNLGDTHVVRIAAGSVKQKYEELEELWGWNKLKDLPSSKLAEKLPQLDDDIVEKWENADYVNNTSSGTSTRRQSRDPSTKRIKVRVGKCSNKYISRKKVSSLIDRLEDGHYFNAGRYSCEYLIIYDQTKISGSTPSTRAASKRDPGIAVTAVPNYVYEYLEGKDNVYTDASVLEEELVEQELDEHDEGDVIIVCSGSVHSEYSGAVDTFREVLNDHTDADIDDDEEISIMHARTIDDINHAKSDDFDARIIAVNGGYKSRSFRDSNYKLDPVDIKLGEEVPDIDHDSPYFKQIFGKKRHLSPDSTTMKRGIKIVKEMDGTFPDQ